nr:polygalacturonase [uncultured bacterium]
MNHRTTHHAAVVTPWGKINEPASPQVCKQLPATLTPKDGSLDSVDSAALDSRPDQDRIQSAINGCAAGQAVQLVKGAGDNSAFLSGPLQLKSGVTLWIDDGVTLFASRNPKDYDNGKGTCGVKSGACLPLISVKGNNAGVMGIRTGGRQGTIDGRGDQTMLGKSTTWWELGENAKKANQVQNSPDLIKVQNSSEFTLYDVNLINAAYFHFFSHIVNGLTIWGVRVKSPANNYKGVPYSTINAKNTDGIDPASSGPITSNINTDGIDPISSKNVTIAHSNISTGDDNVAIKAYSHKGPAQNISVIHNTFEFGHGMSIGSETNGIYDVLVDDLTLNGTENNGVRIKSDSSNAGEVDGVIYKNVTMTNVKNPIVIDPQYLTGNGSSVPDFAAVTINGLRAVNSTHGSSTLEGYDATHPLGLTLENVQLDATKV